jgi:hypothetical protein
MLNSPPNTPSPDPEAGEVPALESYNDAVIGLDLLYEAALESSGAREELRAEAERLVARGARWHDAIHGRGK